MSGGTKGNGAVERWNQLGFLDQHQMVICLLTNIYPVEIPHSGNVGDLSFIYAVVIAN